jgi:three-Cys-motif partner protein
MVIPTSHKFGGAWTEEKLERLRKYLQAYMTIFSKNPKAKKYFKTIYVDAFAGTGSRNVTSEEQVAKLFDDIIDEDPDTQAFFKGSAAIALENTPSFNKYIFLEKKPEYAAELTSLVNNQYPSLSHTVSIHNDEANQFLQDWCQKTDWKRTRAVVFLDPYGMEVKWQTLEVIAETQAIDLWILFPLGQAVNRLLTRDKLPSDAWSHKLTEFFGTEDWKEAFYRKEVTMDLFCTRETVHKTANLEVITDFFVERLSKIFKKVATPCELRNSRGVPIFLLCCAASNPQGAATAIKIANHILKS